jgi:hypothetical protein
MKNTKRIRNSRSCLWKFLFAFLFLTITPLSLSAQTPNNCQQDLDCPLGQACTQGSCQFANCALANNGTDCPHSGNTCLRVSCQWDNDDLGTPFCLEEHIEGAACAFDRDCGSESRCNTKNCECETLQPPADTPPSSLCLGVDCDDHDACTTDSCNENSGLCLHLKIENCPATPPPPEDPSPRSEALLSVPAANPCLTSFPAQGGGGRPGEQSGRRRNLLAHLNRPKQQGLQSCGRAGWKPLAYARASFRRNRFDGLPKVAGNIEGQIRRSGFRTIFTVSEIRETKGSATKSI